MNTNLTFEEKQLIRASLRTRIKHVEKLINGWQADDNETSNALVEAYSTEKAQLQVLLDKMCNMLLA